MKKRDPASAVHRQTFRYAIPLFALLAVYSFLAVIVYDIGNDVFSIAFIAVKCLQTILYILAIAANLRNDLTYSRFSIKAMMILHVVGFSGVAWVLFTTDVKLSNIIASMMSFVLILYCLNNRRLQLNDIFYLIDNGKGDGI
jgi:hypothetical protein